MAACSQSLFALQTLRQHGLPDDALHEVFQSVSTSRLTHLQLGGDLLLQTTETAWKHSYESVQNWVTGLSSRDNFRLYL